MARTWQTSFFNALAKEYGAEVEAMSKSTANTLLQYLVAELTKLWRGEKSESKTAQQAYEICAEIVKEAEKSEQV